MLVNLLPNQAAWCNISRKTIVGFITFIDLIQHVNFGFQCMLTGLGYPNIIYCLKLRPAQETAFQVVPVKRYQLENLPNSPAVLLPTFLSVKVKVTGSPTDVFFGDQFSVSITRSGAKNRKSTGNDHCCFHRFQVRRHQHPPSA